MTEFILELIRWGGYFGIFLLMVLENVFPPVPSEVIMGLGGIAVAQGHMSFVPLLVIGTAGTTVGNIVWYEIGRRVGYQRLRPLVLRYGRWLTLEWEDVERLHGFFQRWGGTTVFVFRFMPTFRTLISLPAGALGMPLGRFLVVTFAGSLIWNGALIGAGYYLGSNFEELQRYVGPVAVALTAAIILWYVWRVITWKPRDPKPPA